MYPKTFTTLLFLMVASMLTGVYAQTKFEVSNGSISFSSNAPLELIQASSEEIKGIIDPATGKFAFIVKMASFKGFNSELQREHFNENYLETDKYYEATFAGKLEGTIDYGVDGLYEVEAKGGFNVHGVKQNRTIPGTIRVKGGNLFIDADFNVLLADHDIKIPKIVNQKIATEIYVKLSLTMTKQEEK